MSDGFLIFVSFFDSTITIDEKISNYKTRPDRHLSCISGPLHCPAVLLDSKPSQLSLYCLPLVSAFPVRLCGPGLSVLHIS